MQAKVTTSTADLLLAHAATLPPGEPLNITRAAEAIGRPYTSTHRAAAKLRTSGKLDRPVLGHGGLGGSKISIAALAMRDAEDAALIAEAAKYPAGTLVVLADIARAVGRQPHPVGQAVKRLRAAGRWRWTHGDGRHVLRKAVDNIQGGPNPAGKPRPKPRPITTGYTHSGVPKPPTPVGRVSMAGNPAMAKCVLVRGLGKPPLDKKEAEKDVADLLAAFRGRSRAEMRKVAFRGAR